MPHIIIFLFIKDFMQKAPIYIGIFLQDSKNGSKNIKDYSRQCLEIIKSKHQDVSVHKDHELLDQIYILPKDNHHVTTLFIGGNQKKLSKEARKNFQNFIPNHKMLLKIDLFVYVPNCIMVGFCSNTGEVEVENKYPHVTLMLTKDTKPVESNSVLELVFQKNPELLKEDYEIKQLDIKYKNSEKIYVVKKEHVMEAITGDNWKNGRR